MQRAQMFPLCSKLLMQRVRSRGGGLHHNTQGCKHQQQAKQAACRQRHRLPWAQRSRCGFVALSRRQGIRLYADRSRKAAAKRRGDLHAAERHATRRVDIGSDASTLSPCTARIGIEYITHDRTQRRRLRHEHAPRSMRSTQRLHSGAHPFPS